MATERIVISGELTAEELQNIMADNATYETNRDLVACQNYIDAARAYIAVPLSEFDHAGERARLEISAIEEQLQYATDWFNVEYQFGVGGGHKPINYISAHDWASGGCGGGYGDRSTTEDGYEDRRYAP